MKALSKAAKGELEELIAFFKASTYKPGQKIYFVSNGEVICDLIKACSMTYDGKWIYAYNLQQNDELVAENDLYASRAEALKTITSKP